MDKQIKDYTREELKEIILDDSKKMNELYPNYRWGQAVFNYVDEYLFIHFVIILTFPFFLSLSYKQTYLLPY